MPVETNSSHRLWIIFMNGTVICKHRSSFFIQNCLKRPGLIFCIILIITMLNILTVNIRYRSMLVQFKRVELVCHQKV